MRYRLRYPPKYMKTPTRETKCSKKGKGKAHRALVVRVRILRVLEQNRNDFNWVLWFQYIILMFRMCPVFMVHPVRHCTYELSISFLPRCKRIADQSWPWGVQLTHFCIIIVRKVHCSIVLLLGCKLTFLVVSELQWSETTSWFLLERAGSFQLDLELWK